MREQWNEESRKKYSQSRSKQVKVIETPPSENTSLGRIFKTVNEAAKFLSVFPGNISDSSKYGWRVKGFKFKYIEQSDLEGEVWFQCKYSIEKYGQKVFGSNKGRITGTRGIKTKGTVEKSRRYRRTKINGKTMPVHRVIWECKYGEIEEGMVIMHDDSIPKATRLDSDGCERNWLSDLSVGTLKENSQSYQKHKKRKLN
jgi:hypothetical protein